MGEMQNSWAPRTFLGCTHFGVTTPPPPPTHTGPKRLGGVLVSGVSRSTPHVCCCVVHGGCPRPLGLGTGQPRFGAMYCFSEVSGADRLRSGAGDPFQSASPNVSHGRPLAGDNHHFGRRSLNKLWAVDCGQWTAQRARPNDRPSLKKPNKAPSGPSRRKGASSCLVFSSVAHAHLTNTAPVSQWRAGVRNLAGVPETPGGPPTVALELLHDADATGEHDNRGYPCRPHTDTRPARATPPSGNGNKASCCSDKAVAPAKGVAGGGGRAAWCAPLGRPAPIPPPLPRTWQPLPRGCIRNGGAFAFSSPGR